MRKAAPLLIRFVAAPLNSRELGQAEGVFKVAYSLVKSTTLPPAQWAQVEAILTWFAQNLRTAPIDDDPRAVCWYKPEAVLYIGKTRELGDILQACGCRVEVLMVCDPGYVVYEDEFQAAAIACTGWQRRVYQALAIQQRLYCRFLDCLLGG